VQSTGTHQLLFATIRRCTGLYVTVPTVPWGYMDSRSMETLRYLFLYT
jgi:hypothetical protein